MHFSMARDIRGLEISRSVLEHAANMEFSIVAKTPLSLSAASIAASIRKFAIPSELRLTASLERILFDFIAD